MANHTCDHCQFEMFVTDWVDPQLICPNYNELVRESTRPAPAPPRVDERAASSTDVPSSPERHKTADKAPGPASPVRTGQRWESVFKSEQEVISRFTSCLDEVTEAVKGLKVDLSRESESIVHAKVKYDSWSSSSSASIFVAPATQATAGVAEELYRMGKYDSAFHLGNVFGEISKLLAARNAQKHSKLLERFIVCGDGDMSHAVRGLVNDGVTVQIWGGSSETSNKYRDFVGAENVVAFDEICGL